MKNIIDLRTELLSTFEGLKEEKVDVNRAHQISNVASKVISTLNTELRYAAQQKRTPKIAFLEVSNDPA